MENKVQESERGKKREREEIEKVKQQIAEL
jgi:hypothetical protein